jgi:hypothetical protein
MNDPDADRAISLFQLAGAMIEGQPQPIAAAVIAQLLASWLMAWPAGEQRADALRKISGAALKLCGGIGKGTSDDVSTGC